MAEPAVHVQKIEQPPPAAAPVVPESAMTTDQAFTPEEEPPVVSRWTRRRKLILIILAMFGLSLIAYYLFQSRQENETADGEKPQRKSFFRTVLGGLLGFDRSGDPSLDQSAQKALAARRTGPNVMQSQESPDSLLELATKIRDAGLQLKGVSQCRYTQIQREAFGGRDSEARKIIEGLYTECRSSEMCPNIRGYPTWTLGDKQWPGNRSTNSLRSIVSEAQTLNPRPMLQGPSEPVVANIPDARHAERTGDEELTPEMAKKLMAQMVKETKDKNYNNAVAEVESNRDGVALSQAPPGGAVAGEVGGAAGGVDGGSEPGTKCDKKIRKENVRGVSNFPPLNVPDMPGTAVFSIDMQHADDQTRQGNAPRASAENHMPTPGVAEQVVRSLEPAETHVGLRTADANSMSRTRLPHTVDITTGEAFADKTVFIPKN